MSAKKPRRNGNNASKALVPPLKKNDILYPSAALQKMLARVYDYWRSKGDARRSAELRRDFIFHMGDWLNDLKELNDLYGYPEDFSAEEAARQIYGIFIHALHHLNAAARILLDREDLRDPFAKMYKWGDEPEPRKSRQAGTDSR